MLLERELFPSAVCTEQCCIFRNERLRRVIIYTGRSGRLCVCMVSRLAHAVVESVCVVVRWCLDACTSRCGRALSTTSSYIRSIVMPPRGHPCRPPRTEQIALSDSEGVWLSHVAHVALRRITKIHNFLMTCKIQEAYKGNVKNQSATRLDTTKDADVMESGNSAILSEKMEAADERWD